MWVEEKKRHKQREQKANHDGGGRGADSWGSIFRFRFVIFAPQLVAHSEATEQERKRKAEIRKQAIASVTTYSRARGYIPPRASAEPKTKCDQVRGDTAVRGDQAAFSSRPGSQIATHYRCCWLYSITSRVRNSILFALNILACCWWWFIAV